MKQDKSYEDLRIRAEQILNRREKLPEAERVDLLKLLHELEVHRIELELQNEELRRIQEELEKSRDDYYSLYDSAPNAYVTINSKGSITRFNQKAEDIFDPKILCLKRNMSSLIHPDDREKYFSTFSGPSPFTRELRILGKDRRAIHCQMEASLQKGNTDKFKWYLAFTDISKQKQVEEKLNLHNRLVTGISSIFESVVADATDEEFGRICLSVAEEITESSISFLAEMGTDDMLHNIAISDMGGEACSMYDREGLRDYPRDFHIHGIYGSAVQKGETIVSNDPASHPEHIGLPEGHPPIESFMGVPLKQGDRIMGMIGIGNRKGGYGSREQNALERLAPVISEAMARRNSERILAESEERLRLVTEGAQLGTWDWDLTTDRLFWNPVMYELLGGEPDGRDIDNRTFFEYIHPDDRERIEVHRNKIIQTGNDFYDEFRIVREDGKTRWVVAAARIFRDQDRQPVRMAGVNYDITDRKSFENALETNLGNLEIRVMERTADLVKLNEELKKEIRQREKFEEELRLNGERILEEQARRKYLSGKLVEMLEKERREMAHTLHDEVGQALVTIITNLDFLKENKDGCSQEVVEEIENIQHRIGNMMEYFSHLSHDLTPHIIQDLGLVRAVENLVKNIRRGSTLKIHFYSRGIPPHISEQKDLAVYRIVQQGITNCIKHAKADNLFINMIVKDGFLLLTLEDDGAGFDYNKMSGEKNGREKLGISIMNERAIQAGGEFYIESQPGKGTQIIVEIPMG